MIKEKQNFELLIKNLMNVSFTLVFSFLIFTVSYAQQELFSYHVDFIPNTKSLNPANPIPNKFVISGLNFFSSLDIKGPSINDINTSSLDNVLNIDPSVIVDALLDDNVLNFNLYFQTINVAVQIKGLEFDFGHAFRQQIHLVYPKQLIELFTHGNGAYIGETMNLGLQNDFTSFHQFNFGIAGKIGKLKLGTNFKFINGIFNLSTGNDKLILHTSDEIYQLKLETDYVINSTGLLSIDDDNSITSELGSLTQFDIFNTNFGLALDFGFIYYASDQLKFSGSLLDLGFINWSQNTENYTLNEDVTFEGILLEDLINNGESLSIKDTLNSFIDFDKSTKEYRTKLSSSLYLSVAYKLSEKLNVSALYYRQMHEHFNSNAVVFSSFYSMNSNFGVGAMYAIRDADFFNLGMSTKLRVGPANLFVMTDNVFAYMRPKNAKHINFRIGGSINF